MSPIRVVIVISILLMYFAFPVVSSPLLATVFDEKEYARVCDEDTWLDLTMPELCEYIPKNLDIGKNLKTRGSCENMVVELEDGQGNDVSATRDLVLCVFGQDNKWCLSAGDSDRSRQAKVYGYRKEKGKMTCMYNRDITIPEKGSGSGQGSSSRSGPKPR